MQKPIQYLLLLLCSITAFGQQNDTLKQTKRTSFSLIQELTSSDYLAAIERSNETMNNVHNEGEFPRNMQYIFKEITNTNADIVLITQNIKEASNTNVRNQRMYEKVLLELREELETYQTALNKETDKIVNLRKSLRTVAKDTVFRKMIKDSVIRKEFAANLKPLRAKFFATDSVLKVNLNILNSHKTETSQKKMIISEALVVVGDRLDKSGIAMFGNECSALWDSKIKLRNQSISSFIAEKFSVERKAFSYYFRYSLRNIFLLMLLMGLLFWWIRSNVSYLRTAGQLESLDEFKFGYLNHSVLIPVIVIGLNVAISLNLYAPALFIEFMHLLLLAALSLLFVKKWKNKAFTRWLLLIAIFAGFCFIDLFLKITLLQRYIFIAINIMSIRFGWVHLKFIKEQMYTKTLFRWGNIIFIAFNALAILFNLFGRVSLAYTLSLTAIIALTQMIALSVLLKIILEIIMLQIFTIRLKRGITKLFDSKSLVKSAQRPFLLLIIYLWIVVIASNLNLSETLANIFDRIFNRTNSIGSFNFTLGSIALFLIIVWIAHLLQKFVAYFFGEIEQGNEETVNKRQHSKLLITRLMLLVAGYLLAISASGMPIDKITIILGALGVGVGLGLQSIVSNFVSGVILIFERPIQIGDVIESGNQSGRVKEIGLRTTKIDTSNGAEVIIPNGNILSQNIVNWTYTNNFRLTDITFSINGAISKDEVVETIITSLNTIDEVVHEMEPQVFFETAGTEKYKIKVKFWCNIYRSEQAISEVRMGLFASFNKKNINMQD